MTTVAITGATGFVGSAIALSLAADGYDIIAFVRSSSDRSILNGINVSWVVGDITDVSSLRGAFNEAEWLIHAAGILGHYGIPDIAYEQVNVEGTRNVLEEAEHCSRILYISSPGVLGPIDGPVADETSNLAPSNSYEQSKAAAEEIAMSLASRGWPIIVARPEFLYGPGDKHVFGIFKAVQRGYFFYVGNGHNTCHPTFIEDAVSGLRLCLERGGVGEIYHIVGPRPVKFRELGETIAAELGVRRPFLSIPRPIALVIADILQIVGNISGRTPPLSRSAVNFFSENRRFSWEKARLLLGYTPQNDLSSGIKQSVDWYRKQGLLPAAKSHDR